MLPLTLADSILEPEELGIPPEIGGEVGRFIDRVEDTSADPFGIVRNRFEGFDPERGGSFRDSAANRPSFAEGTRAFRPSTPPATSPSVRSTSMTTGDSVQVFSTQRPAMERMNFFEGRSDAQQVEQLAEALQRLKTQLGPDVVRRVQVRTKLMIINGVPTEVPISVSVAVRNFNDIFTGSTLYTTSTPPNVPREHVFNFTVDRQGSVIDLDSNRYINGAAFALGKEAGAPGRVKAGDQLFASGIDTAVGIVSTFVSSAYSEAKRGAVDTAFNAMVVRGDYTALGRVVGRLFEQKLAAVQQSKSQSKLRDSAFTSKDYYQEAFEGVLKEIASAQSPTLTDPAIQGQLNKVVGDKQYLEARLYERRLYALRTAFKPVLDEFEKSKSNSAISKHAWQKSYTSLMQRMRDDSTEVQLDGGMSLDISLFDEMKLAVLGADSFGSQYYTMLKSKTSSTILSALYAPFMQPHEASHSAGQLKARVGLYANPETIKPKSFYDLLYSESSYQLRPQQYRHGDFATAPGVFQKPIASGTGSETPTFFETTRLFESSPQLKAVTLGKIRELLTQSGYDGAEGYLEKLRQELALGEGEEGENETIFMAPFRKPEQFSQRLKNFTGSRASREVNAEVRSNLEAVDLHSLNQFFNDQGELEEGKVLAGNLNSGLPAAQFAEVQEVRRKLQQQGLKGVTLSQAMRDYFRREDISPFATRGIIGGRNERRVLVAYGLNEMSDFFYMNADYESSYVDLQITKADLSPVQRNFGAGGVVYNVDDSAGLKELQETFTPGATLYYQETDVGGDTQLMQQVERQYKSILQEVGGRESLAAFTLKRRLGFVSELTLDLEGGVKNVKLKPGLYGVNASGEVELRARMEGDLLHYGTGRSLKVPSQSKTPQKAIAVVARPVSNSGEVTFGVTHKQTAGMRPGVDFTKGPAAFFKSDLPETYDQDYGDQNLFARDTQQDKIFALMGTSGFKGYNFESGLTALRDEQSRRNLTGMSAEKMAMYLSLIFMGDGDKQTVGRFKQAARTFAAERGMPRSLQLLLAQPGKLGAGFGKLQGLVLQATPIVALGKGFEDSGQQNLASPIRAIQSRLISVLESGDADELERFRQDVGSIFEAAVDDSRSFEEIRKVGNELVPMRIFNENDATVRAAALLADTLLTLDQAAGYRGLSSNKSLLSINLADSDGRVRASSFLQKDEAAIHSILNFAYRSGIDLPSDQALRRLRSGELGEDSQEYQELELGLLNLYSQTQRAPLIQKAIKYLPSRVLVAAGSEDAVALEYHYTANMSTRALKELGYDDEDLTALQVAYTTILSHGDPYRFKHLEFVLPGGTRQPNRVAAELADVYTPLLSSERRYGKSRNQTLLESLTEAQVKGDKTQVRLLLDEARRIKTTVQDNTLSISDRARLLNRQTSERVDSAPVELDGKRILFFDLETYDIGNQQYAKDDARRYPNQIAEVSFTRLNPDGTQLTRSFLIKRDGYSLDRESPFVKKFDGSDFSQAVSLKEAMDALAQEMREADYVAGHNIRDFDLPTVLKQRPELREVFEGKNNVIDTLRGLNRDRTKAELGVRSFKLGELYRALELEKLQGQLKSAVEAGEVEEARRIAKAIADPQTFEFGAHRAEEDVGVNIRVFQELYQRGLLYHGISDARERGGSRIPYFGDSAQPNDSRRRQYAQEIVSLAEYAKGRSLVYEYERQFDQGNQPRYDEDFRKAIDLVTDELGRFKGRGGNAEEQLEYVERKLLEYDAQLEDRIRSSSTSSPTDFVKALQEQARVLRGSGEAGAEALRGITQTQAYLVPTTQTTYNELTGKYELEEVSSKLMAAPVYGLDVLENVPKQFKDYVSEVIQTQQQLRALTPEHFDLMTRLRNAGGKLELNVREAAVVDEVQRLAVQAQEQSFQLGASVLKQRAYGEGIKYPGVSFIAMASPLLGIEEVAYPDRIGEGFQKAGRKSQQVLGRMRSKLYRLDKEALRLNEDREKAVLRRQEVEEARAAAQSRLLEHRATLQERLTNLPQIEDRLRSLQASQTLPEVRPQQSLDSRLQRVERVRDRLQSRLEKTEQRLGAIEKEVAQAGQPLAAIEEKLNRVMQRSYNLRTTAEVIEKYDLGSMRGYVNRAGGPHQASVVSQKSVGLSLEELIKRGEKEGTFLQLSEQGNETAMFMPMFGRFGTQGGDFDGDAYQLLFGFKDVQMNYLKALEDRERLAGQKLSLQKELYRKDLDDDYRAYRQANLQTVEAELAEAAQRLEETQARLPQAQESAERIRRNAIAGVRRHTAAYYGAPVELFSEQAGVFSNREIFDMIQQQRGIIGSAEDYAKSASLNNSDVVRMFAEVNRREGFNAALQAGARETRDYVLQQLNQSFERIDDTQKQRVADLVEIGYNDFRSSAANTLVELQTQRLNQFVDLASEASAMQSVIEGQSTMLSAAAGMSMSARTFEVLQTVIGSQGTSLIGEAYNAITTLAPQAMMARAFAESMGTPGVSAAVDASGLEYGAPLDWSDRVLAGLPKGELDAQAHQARTLLQHAFAPGRRTDLVRTAAARAEDLTGKLAVVQQVIRDSLKLKEAGGLLSALRAQGVDGAFEDRFLNAEPDARYQMLRNFISGEYGADLRDTKGSFMENRGSYTLNAFGALLLISDYARVEPEEQEVKFRQMLSEDGQGRYAMLRQRRLRYEQELETLAPEDPRRSFVERMATDDEYLIRRTAFDLLNAVVAEKKVDTMLQDRNTVEFTSRTRTAYLKALAGEEGSEYDALRQVVGLRELAQTYDITEEDVGRYRDSGQVRDIFAGEELRQLREQEGLEIEEGKFEDYRLKRAQAIEYEANIRYRELSGMTDQDLVSMRKTLTAARDMRFDTAEVASDFSGFLSAEAENLEAFRAYSRREHLAGPEEFKGLQLQVSSSYADALVEVNRKLSERYGSVAQAMSNEEVSRAYLGMVGMSGLFDQLEVAPGQRLADLDDTVRQDVTRMLALSAAKPGEGGAPSLMEELANRFAGMKAVYQAQTMLLSGKTDSSGESERILRDYQSAVETSKRDRAKAPETFFEQLGREIRSQGRPNDLSEQYQNRLDEADANKRKFATDSLTSILAGPVAAALLAGNISLDENLMARSLDLVQAFASVDDFTAEGKPKRLTAGMMFQAARLRQQIEQEDSAVVGGVRGALTEALFNSIGELSHRAVGRGAGGTMAAELLATTASMGVVAAMSGKRVGPKNEVYQDYIGNSITQLAEQAAAYLQASLESLTDPDVEVEGDDSEEVDWEFQPDEGPDDYQDAIETGWMDIFVQDGSGESDIAQEEE